MKKIILIIVFVLFVINLVFSQSAANPDTVCVGSIEEYKIENPDNNSTYTWGIYKGDGTVQTATNQPKITIKWNETEGIDSVWVFETNKAGCTGDTAKLKVLRVVGPTAQFKEENLCYGQDLQIIFTGTAPYTIEYTVNGNAKTVANIKTNKYMLSGESGNYQLTKVYTRTCAGTLSSGIINATIAKPLKKLRIIRSH